MTKKYSYNSYNKNEQIVICHLSAIRCYGFGDNNIFTIM